MPPTRNLQLPETNTSLGGFARPETQGDSYTEFNNRLLELLKRHQALGTKKYAEQGFDAQALQNKRITKTPSDLIGAAPGVQSSARSASVGAIDPTIQGAQQAQQTFGEQIRSFGDVLNNVRQFGADYQTKQDGLKTEARNNLLLAVQLGGADGLNAIKKANPNIFKIAGLDEETLIESARAKEKSEKDEKKTFSTIDLGDRIGVFDNQGNLVREVAKGATPGATDKEGDKAEAQDELIGLLNQYREVLSGSNFGSRVFDPQTVTSLASLKGQITAVYKKQQQLGTLDAGVQKLIDTIIPGQGIGVNQLSTQAQLDALDNFITNQGGVPGITNGVTDGVNEYLKWLTDNNL